jgi:peptide/nickel transport system substrate-binding protein
MSAPTSGIGPRRHAATRRTLGAVALGAAAVACGPGPAAPPSGTPAPEAPGQPRPGGSIVIRQWTGDPPDLDPFLNVTFRAQEFAGFFYSRLLKFGTGPGVTPNAFVPAPDLAESYEVSKDGLSYTFKLRRNATWQRKPPLDGRPVTADDVVWSFERFMKVSPQRDNLGMVKGVQAVDPHTVVFTLGEPFAPFETTIASPLLWIMPREVIEADGDARQRVIGSGPFVFERFEKGVQVVARRNPDYYLAPRPYVDEVVLLIVPEDATAVAGLRSKAIDVTALSQTDRNAVAAADPQIQLLDYPQNLISFMYWKVGGPPFDDVRVRQAVSLALDRDETIGVLYEGRGTYNNAIPAALESWYLDPRSAEMGPGGKYFKRDVAGAKQLLAAAGHANGLKVPLIASLNAYGNVFNQGVELVIKQLKEAGIEADLRPQDYSAYVSSTFLGRFDPGTMVWGLQTPFQEPHDYLFNMYHPKGARSHAAVDDPTLTRMIEQQMRTIDRAERKKLVFDVQKYLGERQLYAITTAGNVTIARQPWVKNFHYQTDYGRAAEYLIDVWLEGKPG